MDRELVPGVKLKTENKKPIVGLAVHPTGAAWAWLGWCGIASCGAARHSIAQHSTLTWLSRRPLAALQSGARCLCCWPTARCRCAGWRAPQ